ncbi:hypothetical protein DYB32_006857 [Aphanomyces invadans]|uniref:C3H1-type domain-containing protein n=1 Tax=Aphanomyces invadans TaxID=157072 RepID=A0A3R6ZME3_9STRA|nr:hypothetical protein DYB32_006857 [Aphanomyces invadans]
MTIHRLLTTNITTVMPIHRNPHSTIRSITTTNIMTHTCNLHSQATTTDIMVDLLLQGTILRRIALTSRSSRWTDLKDLTIHHHQHTITRLRQTPGLRSCTNHRRRHFHPFHQCRTSAAPGCDFSASKRVVTSHYQVMHGQYAGSGLKEIEVEGQKFQEITKWREERRKKWPSESNVKRKEHPAAELNAATSAAQLPDNEVASPRSLHRAKPASSKKKSSKFCVKFIRNGCDDGDKCLFNHDIEVPRCGAAAMTRFFVHQSIPCKQFLAKGSCKRGTQCKFSHTVTAQDKLKQLQLQHQKEQASQVKQHRSSLLRKLLAKDIDKEHRHILQAFRHLVEHHFFQPSADDDI